MKILICGSRGWTDREAIYTRLALVDHAHKVIVVEGGAHGADRLAKQAAKSLGLEVREYSADWDTHGLQAGFKRNQEMLDVEHPDLVWAFWDGSSRGTKHMIDIAREQGYTVEVFRA